MAIWTDQIVCIIWRFSFPKQIHCPVIPFVGFMLHNLFVIAMSPARPRFEISRLEGFHCTKILPWGSCGRWLTLISDPVLWETEQPWKKKHEFAEEDMEKSLKRKHGETFSDLHPKNNWHGKQQLVSFQWCHPRTSCWWLLEWSSLLCRS